MAEKTVLAYKPHFNTKSGDEAIIFLYLNDGSVWDLNFDFNSHNPVNEKFRYNAIRNILDRHIGSNAVFFDDETNILYTNEAEN